MTTRWQREVTASSLEARITTAPRAAAQVIPDAIIKVFAGRGHPAPEDKPTQIASAILEHAVIP